MGAIPTLDPLRIVRAAGPLLKGLCAIARRTPIVFALDIFDPKAVSPEEYKLCGYCD